MSMATSDVYGDNDYDLNTLKTVQTHMKSAQSVMQAAKRHRPSQLESLQPSAKKLAPNVLHEKQVRFVFNKKEGRSRWTI